MLKDQRNERVASCCDSIIEHLCYFVKFFRGLVIEVPSNEFDVGTRNLLKQVRLTRCQELDVNRQKVQFDRLRVKGITNLRVKHNGIPDHLYDNLSDI